MGAPARASEQSTADSDVTHNPYAVLGDIIARHRGAWTEADYMALPEGVRAELHDGNLILVPEPLAEHQYASDELKDQLKFIVGDRRRVVGPVDVRINDGDRYRSPDVVLVREPYRGKPASPENVLLVCEIISPGGGDEWDQKMEVYAKAGIPWYLILQETPAGFYGVLFSLDVDRYVKHSQAAPAGTLDLPEPFRGTLRLRELTLSV